MAESKHTDLLFVYGTLMHDANPQLSFNLQDYGKNRKQATFRGKLYDVGSYPAAIASDQETDKIFGELYKLTNPELAFVELDVYEGYRPKDNEESDYIRKVVTVYTLSEQKAVKAWIYLYNKSVDKLSPIPGGNYIEYLQTRSSSE